jgi:Rrf2 family protein
MRFSLKADYAIRASLELALRGPASPVASTAQIARRIAAPPKFLEAVMAQLRRGGLVESVRGVRGGHRLARPAARISAGDVLRALDGPEALAPRPSSRRPPADGAARAVHQMWKEAGRAVAGVLDGTTLEDLTRSAEEASGNLDYAI